jgi:molybdopterin converting factor small subunit
MESESLQIHVTLYGGARVVSGQSMVDLSFEAPHVTLAQVVEELIATYPRARPYLLSETGALNASIRVLVNNERLDPADALATVLHAEDHIVLLVAVAGG